MKRHFLRLVRDAPGTPTVVILGAGGTRTFYEIPTRRGPVPSEAQVVVARRPRRRGPVLGRRQPRPMRAKMAGLSRQVGLRGCLKRATSSVNNPRQT